MNFWPPRVRSDVPRTFSIDAIRIAIVIHMQLVSNYGTSDGGFGWVKQKLATGAAIRNREASYLSQRLTQYAIHLCRVSNSPCGSDWYSWASSILSRVSCRTI